MKKRGLLDEARCDGWGELVWPL